MVLETRLYDELNVTPDVTSEEIRSAYKALVLQWHPDKNPYVDAERFRAIKYAHEVLQDPESRDLYDNEGEEGLERERNRNQKTSNEQQYEYVQVVYQSEIYLNELYSLNKKIFVLRVCKMCEGRNDQCVDCDGMTLLERVDINMNRLISVSTGTELVEQFAIYGERYKPAILILKLIEVPHNIYKRDGYNLITRLTIDFIASLTELNYVISTPNDKSLHIKKTVGKTTQDKEKCTLEGCGLPYEEDGVIKFGDLIVFCRVSRPSEGFQVTQMLLNTLPPSPHIPGDGGIEEVKIKFIEIAANDSYEDLLDPRTPDELYYNCYFEKHY